MSYAEKIEALIAERDALRRWKSTNAPRIEALAELLRTAQIDAEAGREALATLEGERAANALLTDEIATLRAKLAAAEARAERLAGALEWIQRQDLDDLRMQLVVDAERDGQYYVCGDSNKPGYGPTLLDAVERAALAEGEAG